MKSHETIISIRKGIFLNLKDEAEVQNRLKNSVREIYFQVSKDFKDWLGYVLNREGLQIFLDDDN